MIDIVWDVDFGMLLLMFSRCLILYNLLAVIHHFCYFFCSVGQREG